jgi:hypothetical protein
MAKPDTQQAGHFLTLLDEGAEDFTFQTFDDDKNRKDSSLVRILNGSFESVSGELVRLNKLGAGVFVTINETDLKGRKTGNMQRVRAVWQEADRGDEPTLPCEPHIKVESSPGKYHQYILTDTDQLDEFAAVQLRMVDDYGSDPNAKDLSRVLRLPGFYHQKNPQAPHLVKIIHESGEQPLPWNKLKQSFPPVTHSGNADKPKGTPTQLDNQDEVESALNALIPDDGYNTWLHVGMALHSTGGGEQAFKLWDEWSARGVYREGETAYKWSTFSDDGGITLKTLFGFATDKGWKYHGKSTVDDPNAVQAKLDELAQLDAISYGQARKAAAAELRIPVTILDKAVKQAQPDNGNGEGSTADELVNIVNGCATLFVAEEGDGFATFDAGDHKETWGIDSEGFREWLGYKYFQQTGRAPGDSSLTTALNTLRGIAKHEGDELKVWLRCAPHQDGYLIDLCDEQWRAVYITPHGWQVLDQSPVIFTRTKNMSALPVPGDVRDFSKLWNYANVSKEDRPFVAAWMVDACRPDTPYPPLELGGFYGHAKSSTQKAIRRVIDPSRVDLRVEPKTTEDLLVAARNNHIVSLNNISHLSPARQDALCSISTGGGVGGRKFYTNSEESLFEIKRAVMINGIKTLATAPDLVDRTVRVELPKLVAYRKESEMWAEYEKDHGVIFGGFLDLFARTLSILPSVEIRRPPRMADFAYLGEALFEAHKIAGGFTNVYAAKRQLAADKALEGSPVAQTIRAFIDARITWSGTMGDLYDQLSVLHTSPSAWPKSPRGLGDQLRVIAPAMAMLGFRIEFDPIRKNDGYHVLLGHVPTSAGNSTRSQRSPCSSDQSEDEESMTYGAQSERSEHGEHIEVPAGAHEGCAQCGGEGCQWCSSSINHLATGAQL